MKDDPRNKPNSLWLTFFDKDGHEHTLGDILVKDWFDENPVQEIHRSADAMAEMILIQLGELPFTNDDKGNSIFNPKYVEKHGEPKSRSNPETGELEMYNVHTKHWEVF